MINKLKEYIKWVLWDYELRKEKCRFCSKFNADTFLKVINSPEKVRGYYVHRKCWIGAQ